jgi:hypothetical protein
MDLENEIWIDIPDYEGLYQLSNLGYVKSTRHGKERILKAGTDRHGYLYVILCKNGKTAYKSVHRLVYESFNGKTNLSVDHIVECNKTDNRLCNLQAITQRKNVSKYKMTLKKSSQYTGVCWNNKHKKWQASIRINGKPNNLGLFINEIDAAEAYQNKLKQIT